MGEVIFCATCQYEQTRSINRMPSLLAGLRLLTIAYSCYGANIDSNNNISDHYVNTEAKSLPLNLLPTDSNETITFNTITNWRKFVSPVMTYPPFIIASVPFYSEAITALKRSEISEDSLNVILPHLSRFQNFYDDLMVLGERLSGAQYTTALQYAKRELQSEISKMAKEPDASSLTAPLNRMGWALLRVVLLDSCVRTQKGVNIVPCADRYLSVAIPSTASD